MIKSPHNGMKITGYKKIKHGEMSPHGGITTMGYRDF
jgi:hypothetical protein